MKTLVVGAWLGILSYWDFKYKQIPLWYSLIGALVGAVFLLFERTDGMGFILSLLPGVIALVMAWITREAIGYGDGVVMLVLGLYLTFSQIVFLVMAAILFAGTVALLLLVIRKKSGKYRMAFVPFLAVAYGFLLWMEGGLLG